MSIDVRPTRPDEYRRASSAMAIALLNTPPSDETWARIEASWTDGRSFSAWDGDQCVGHAAHYPVETVVPGGAMVTTAAVARVGVLPTHRRLGIGGQLLRAIIADAVASGTMISSLRASEGTIYGRYGYGIAGSSAAVTIDRRKAQPLAGRPADGRFRILEPDEIVATVGALYERVGLRRVGAITRPEPWTARVVRAAVEQSAASFVAVHTNPEGIDDGYVHYSVDWNDDHDPWIRATGEVRDLFGADDAVETALWHFVLGVDLVDRWRAPARPTDDLARHLTADPRAYQVTMIEDEQWIRILDVDAFLSARTYGPATGSVVIGVEDALVAGNVGAWRVDPTGAERSDDQPDLRCDIAALSSLSLGGSSWTDLVGAGIVTTEHREAVDVADTLFASRRAPFCGTFF